MWIKDEKNDRLINLNQCKKIEKACTNKIPESIQGSNGGFFIKFIYGFYIDPYDDINFFYDEIEFESSELRDKACKDIESLLKIEKELGGK